MPSYDFIKFILMICLMTKCMVSFVYQQICNDKGFGCWIRAPRELFCWQVLPTYDYSCLLALPSLPSWHWLLGGWDPIQIMACGPFYCKMILVVWKWKWQMDNGLNWNQYQVSLTLITPVAPLNSFLSKNDESTMRFLCTISRLSGYLEKRKTKQTPFWRRATSLRK